jgi:hypothetical protein
MSTTIRIAVISLALLALLVIGPSARADGFDITGGTNTATCQEFDLVCQPLEFSLLAKTRPIVPDLFLITSLTGEINGQRITAPSPDGVLQDCECGFGNHGPIPFAPELEFIDPSIDPNVYFFLDGQKGLFSFDDMVLGSVTIEGGRFAVGEPVTWNAVPTPEPASLLLLGVGILALGVLGTAKRFL